MRGIVGYIGEKEAFPIIIKGLKRLEYRGYDSAGVAVINDTLKVFKTKGKVSDLLANTNEKDTSGTIGIGHTRWATHGHPSNENAHPHTSQSKNITLIHNGIIENYNTIKKELVKRGHIFESDTDTEVLTHLIEEIKNQEDVSLFEAVRLALSEVIGAYAIAVIDKFNSNEIVVAKKGSPLVIGIGENEYFLASDAAPIIEYTKNVVYLEDGEIASLSLGKEMDLKTIDNVTKTPYIQELEMHLEAIEKGGFDHFMLKEIFEQPISIKDSIRGRINYKEFEIKLGGLQDYEQKIINADRIIIVACGTSWHAGLIGEYLFEDLKVLRTLLLVYPVNPSIYVVFVIFEYWS